ncbi:MAG TPA: DUF4149 domain-containing protein [Candidatus Limnocylindria bacterium]
MDTFYGDVLRAGYHLGLAVIVGGGFALGALAAPAIFRTIRSRGEAGTVFGAILERYDGFAILALILVALTTILKFRAFEEDPRDARTVLRWVALALMGMAVLYGSAWANPVARAIRKQTPGFDDLPDNDIRKREFRSLHARSARAFTIAVVFGVAAVYLS